MNRSRSWARVAVGTLLFSMVATFLVASCGSEAQSSNASAAPATAAIELSDIWARTSPAVAGAGAVYVTIDNTGGLDDALTAVRVDPSIAMMAELHETVAVAAEAGASTAAGGMATSAPASEAMPMGTAAGDMSMMEMRPVDRIVVPAYGSVMLAPGGYHIMLQDLVEPLTVGSTLDLTLTFETAGDRVVTASVRDMAP